MKTLKKTIAAFLSFLLLFSPLNGIPFELPVFGATGGTTGDCTWRLDGTVLTISGNGAMGDYAGETPPWGSEITKAVIEEGVTSISDHAFFLSEVLEEISIPKSVTAIGTNIFGHCVKLSSITVEAGNPVFHSSGNCLIETATKTLLYGCKASVIPDDGSVETIGENAFFGCRELVSITIPGTVTTIDSEAFFACEFKSIVLSEGLETIGEWAFAYCWLMESIALPKSLKSVGEQAFGDCEALSDVWYSGSEEDRKEIRIAEANYNLNVATWHYDVCPNSSPENNAHVYDNDCDTTCNLCGITRSAVHSYKAACSIVCSICGEKRSNAEPHSFTDASDTSCNLCGSIGGNTGDCVWTIDGTVLTISGSGKMDDCGWNTAPWGTKITKVMIKNGVTSIGDFAFWECRSLTEIEIPSSVTSIGREAFCGSGFVTLKLPDSITHIAEKAFCNAVDLVEIVLPGSLTGISDSMFSQCYSLKTVKIPDSVTTIGDSAFYDCNYLTDVKLPSELTTIGNGAFFRCNSLKSVEFPDKVKIIGNGAFESCRNLVSVKFPTGLTTIEAYAFALGPTFEAIEIPVGVTKIGEFAFLSCSLECIKVAEGNPVYHSSGNCIIETESKTLVVGCENSVIPTDGSVITIGSSAFQWCGSLTSITIPNAVTAIGDAAFYDCSSLTSVTIPDSVTTIGWDAFSGCRGLTDVWYLGTEEDRTKIFICSNNTELTGATWHYVDNACDTSCNKCDAIRAVKHKYDNFEDLICNICGYERPPFTPGDVDGVEGVDMDDAIYVLFHCSFPEDYPVNQNLDFDKSGEVDMDDAIYLLFHCSFPEDYPLY